jgi:PAS domain S-box-containing protein
MIGYSCEELSGMHLSAITHPNDIEKGQEIVQQSVEGSLRTGKTLSDQKWGCTIGQYQRG